MLEKRRDDLWRQLQGKKTQMPNFLTAVELDGLRGLDNLRVTFDYPVSVIAGGNATGKTTVLFAAACAYDVPNAPSRDFAPSTLFPSYSPQVGARTDAIGNISLAYSYITPDGDYRMQWRKLKSWSRSYFGRKAASQPRRDVFLRTLSNLSSPSEVRGVLSMSRASMIPQEAPLTASEIRFAHQVLSFRYDEIVDLTSGKKRLLFASQHGGPSYSELQMASGERAVVRLAQSIALLNDALVLIDEVEAGLHPWVQQVLMLELQQLALRNNLQIIVTSHSPVVLDSVPENARIFLHRAEDNRVIVLPAHRDIVQDALYGRSHDTLNVLCEDDIAEGILRGVIDHLTPTLGLSRETIRIGRDTGASQFPEHARALQKFGQVGNMLFVLDGDVQGTDLEYKIREAASGAAGVCFLPGNAPPEVWIWKQLRSGVSDFDELGIGSDMLSQRMDRLDSVYDSASDRPGNIAKSKLSELAEILDRSPEGVCRFVARHQAGDAKAPIRPLVDEMNDIISRWRA